MLIFRCGLIFCYSSSIGLTYFIPTAIFSIKFGQTDTATVSALMDFVGYAFVASFDQCVNTDAKISRLEMVWAIYSVITAFSAIITYYFMSMLEVDNTIEWSNLKT